MQTSRKIAHAPRCHTLAQDIASMPSTCVGCTDCQGICAALIDALILPELIIRDRAV